MRTRWNWGAIPSSLALALVLPIALLPTPAVADLEDAESAASRTSAAIAPGESAAAPFQSPQNAEVGEEAVEAAESDAYDDAYDDALWGDEVEDEAAARDPLEGSNRAIFKFNQIVDGVFWRPLTKGYQFVVPEVARIGVRRFFRNVNFPSTMVNDLLQGRPLDAGRTLGRFVINSTLGFAGFFDAASQAGEEWEGHESDFGQTLALAGVPSGPYVVVPFLGPNTVRDGLGNVADLAMQPLTYFLLPVQLVFAGGAWGLSIREENADELDALRESSLDYYASLRSAYFQNRKAEIWGDSPPDDGD